MTHSDRFDSYSAEEDDEKEWNKLVDSVEGANLAQRFEWREILDCVGLPAEFVMVQGEEGVVGCISFRVSEDEGPECLVSPPNYCDGGPAVRGRSKEVLREAISHARSLHKSVPKVMIQSTLEDLLPGASKSGKCNMVLPLAPRHERTIHRYSSSTRRKIRRATETVDIVVCDKDGLGDFFPLYRNTMQEKGAWAKSLEFFNQLLTHFDRDPCVNLSVAEHKGNAVAGLVYSIYKDTLILLYSGWDRSYAEVNANFALVGHAIERAHERGCSRVNFGLTPLDEEHGLYQFKARWGAEPECVFALIERSGIKGITHNLGSRLKGFLC